MGGTATSVCAAVLTISAPALAYSTRSVVSDACHERITQRALRRARAANPTLAELPARARDDRALLEVLPFELHEGLNELGAATLVLGNRHVDLQDNEPDDLDQLAVVHGDPANQAEHCLRRPDQNGEAGALEAIQQCREFIAGQVEAALQGLDDDGTINGEDRVKVDVYLDIRGQAELALPRFYFHMGQALHALQDSFSHTYRSDDHHRVVTVLNYVELVEGDLEESTDGPPHSSPMDSCAQLDSYREERFETAVQASADLLLAALSQHGASEDRVTPVLDEYLTLCSAGNDYCGNGVPCTADNAWCGAPEAQYRDESSCRCAVPGRSSSHRGGYAAVALLALAWAARRRRALTALAVLGLGAAWPQTALAQTDPPVAPAPVEPAPATPPVDPAPAGDASMPGLGDPAPAPSEAAPAPAPVGPKPSALDLDQPHVVVPVRADYQDKVFPLGVALNGSFALENAAFAAAIGLRYRFNANWQVGADAEYNPWFSLSSGNVRSGSFNAYATGVLRFPMQFDNVNLRTTVQFGMSRMLFDLPGVPNGSTGLFVGLNLLGVDIELGRSLYLIINPAHIAVPIPQLEGVPFAYPQYRVTLGIQVGA